jgi:hypothetical protein
MLCLRMRRSLRLLSSPRMRRSLRDTGIVERYLNDELESESRGLTRGSVPAFAWRHSVKPRRGQHCRCPSRDSNWASPEYGGNFIV